MNFGKICSSSVNAPGNNSVANDVIFTIQVKLFLN